jgi:hypothetical protein
VRLYLRNFLRLDHVERNPKENASNAGHRYKLQIVREEPGQRHWCELHGIHRALRQNQRIITVAHIPASGSV